MNTYDSRPGRRRVRGHRVRQVPGGGARHHLVAELLGLRERHRHHAVLERVRRVGGVVLHEHLPHAERLGEPRRALERGQPDRKAGLRRSRERQEVGVAPERLRARLDLPLGLRGVEPAVVVRDLERPEALLAHVASVERIGGFTFLALKRLNWHESPFYVENLRRCCDGGLFRRPVTSRWNWHLSLRTRVRRVVAGVSQGHVPPPLSMQRLCSAAGYQPARSRMGHVNVLDDPLRPDAEPAEATSQALRPRTGRSRTPRR